MSTPGGTATSADDGGDRSAPPDVRFCARCGGVMVTRLVAQQPRRTCPECGFVHFTDPKVAVGGFVVQEDAVLLVQRRLPPAAGRWCVPGGYLDAGENPRAAAEREVAEESGLQVSAGAIVDTYFTGADDGAGASVFLLYACHVVGGTLQAGDDATDAGFFRPDELPELAFANTADAIRRWTSGGSSA